MTLDEKIDYLGGERGFFIRGVPRLGIPEIKMSDGPAGCRSWGPSTAYPAPVGMAAAFDVALAEHVGRSMGRDCRARGVHILLGPGVNIQRSPLGGRNFEYMGEDPWLAGETAAAFVRGVQAEGVLATVKHFAANNQEWDRNHISSEVDPRTLREIYFPAFERAVRQGGVAAVMTAYNLLNGTYCSQDAWLVRDVLKQQWGFGGFVMSDWGAVHDTLGALRGGCDLEMPSGQFMNREALRPLLDNHTIDVPAIDEKVLRILRPLVTAGFLDRPQERRDLPLEDPESAAVALDAARRSIVLLQNRSGLLPLDRTKYKHIAVIGPNAQPAVVGGSGSAFVTPVHTISVLDGIKHAVPGLTVDYHPGVRQASDFTTLGKPCFAGPVEQAVFAGTELAGSAAATTTVDRIDHRPPANEAAGAFAGAAKIGSEQYSIRWKGQVVVAAAGPYRVTTNADDGIRVRIDGKLVIDDWTQHNAKTNAVTLNLMAGPHAVVVEYFQASGPAVAQFGFAPVAVHPKLDGGDEVAAVARKADVVIVSIGFGQIEESNSVRTPFVGLWPPAWARESGLVESEDTDRPFDLPAAQIETVLRAAKANPRTIVLVNAGGGVDVRAFVDRVPALLWGWYPGQEGGRAVADILFGDVSPSGKLPVTLGKRLEDYPSTASYHVNRDGKTPYAEGVLVGYRGFDAHGVVPQFPFGFGLSYTTFGYSDLSIIGGAASPARVAFKITNAGSHAGDEIAEVYVAPPSGPVPRPPKELKGYARVSLRPGESREVTIALEPRAFAYWDVAQDRWMVQPGTYEILVGAASNDVRLRGRIDVAGAALPP
jgi:beta-glucosidase